MQSVRAFALRYGLPAVFAFLFLGWLGVGDGSWRLVAAPGGPLGGVPAPAGGGSEGDAMEDVVFVDVFPDGQPAGKWEPFPHFNLDNLRGARDPSAPSGGGIGVLSNDNAGGFAALSYAATPPLAEFRLETWLRVQVTQAERGPLNGVAFLVDPQQASYYRIASDFSGREPSLSLAYVGRDTNNFPQYLMRWRGSQLPGGVPRESGWHRLAVEVREGRAEIWWDGEQLPGGPFLVDRIAAGQVGVYATFTGGRGRAETMVDDFRLRGRPAAAGGSEV